jgi:hypothetical protein
MKKEPRRAYAPTAAQRLTMCCARSPEVTAVGCYVYCTRERGHDGDHIAQAGDRAESLVVVGRWSASDDTEFKFLDVTTQRLFVDGLLQPSMLAPVGNDPPEPQETIAVPTHRLRAWAERAKSAQIALDLSKAPEDVAIRAGQLQDLAEDLLRVVREAGRFGNDPPERAPRVVLDYPIGLLASQVTELEKKASPSDDDTRRLTELRRALAILLREVSR